MTETMPVPIWAVVLFMLLLTVQVLALLRMTTTLRDLFGIYQELRDAEWDRKFAESPDQLKSLADQARRHKR